MKLTTNEKYLYLLILLFFFLQANSAVSQTIELTVTGLKSDKGSIQVAIFKDNISFENEEPFKYFSFSKKNLIDGKMKVSFNLQEGSFGISVLDDEDNDEEMDYNFLGIPEEGFGFSDYYHKGLSRPVFDDFKFVHKKGEAKKIKVKMRYI